jgi:hypothetical protein
VFFLQFENPKSKISINAKSATMSMQGRCFEALMFY